MRKKKRTIMLLTVVIIVLSGLVGFGGWKNFKVDISIGKKTELEPQERIEINFSFPVAAQTFRGIKIKPAKKISWHWENKNRKLVITPLEKWDMETEHGLEIPPGRSFVFSKIDAQTIRFKTLDYPKITEFFPPAGAEEVVLGIEDPIIFSFDKALANYSLKFSFNPEIEAAFQVDDEKKQVKILSKTELKSGEKYEIKILVKHKEETPEKYKEIHYSYFTTLPPSPATWEKDFTLRLAQARKYTRAKVKEGRYIDINLAGQIMSIFENGKLLDSFLVSSGKNGMETPKGEFSIRNKAPRVWSKKYSLWMPLWMAVASDGSFGIHELPEWPGGFKEGASHLGARVSHGCIRLGVGPAKQVYDFSEVGTPVIIY